MMKKIIISLLVVLVLLSFLVTTQAATVTPSVKGQARFEKGPGRLTSSWHMAACIVTNARNDTIVFTRDINTFFDQSSAVALFGVFKTNNAGADSGDITMKLEVGWDSAHYYIPIADTVAYRKVGLAADTLASGEMGTVRNYNGYFYNQTLNDSTLTYPLYTIQPKSASTGFPLQLPIMLPRDHFGDLIPLTRFRLILSKGTKFKSGDTTWVNSPAIVTWDLFK